MAKKQRRFEQAPLAAPEKTAPSRYEDVFQQKVGKGIEEIGKKVEGRGRTLLYALGAVVVLAILIAVFNSFSKRSNAEAQSALAKAIETSKARITDTPPVAGTGEKTYKTEKERADAAIAQFQAVVDNYGGAAGEKAKYFIAVTKLFSDRPAAITELEAMANGTSDVAKLAKFALAQTRAEDGRFDEAATLYNELLGMPDPLIAKDTVNFELAKVYEKQGKTAEAADLYFQIAKTASEAKDADGKAISMGQTARDAKEKLESLDPARAKEIKEAEQPNPFGGGLPIGM